MANIQQAMTDVQANLDSHAFDLSERHLFTAKAGQLLPVYNKQVVPGDYFEIDPLAFIRTMPLNTAAYARMRQHIDVFFVPYVQLWHQFPQFKYQREDPVSATFTHGKVSPYMNLYDLYKNVLCDVSKLDTFGFKDIMNRIRLCDLLGYGSLRNSISYDDGGVITVGDVASVLTDKHVTMWPWLAYQKIYNDYYRNQLFDVAVNASNFNVDDVQGTDLAKANLEYVRWPNPQNPPTGYNSALDGIFTLRYRQWKKDYFTGLFPNPQFGGVSVMSPSGFLRNGANIIGNSVSVGLHWSADSENPSGLATTGNASNLTGTQTQKDTWTLVDSMSAIDVRRMELLQVWKEKTLRAGYRSESQQMAHFGVRSRYIADEHVEYLGGVSQLIDINEVVSTSISGVDGRDNGLGQIGGKGVSLNSGNKIKFNAKDDGVIMVIFSVLPESDYPAFGVAKEHTRIDPFDYFTPGLQNLGFSAVGGDELLVNSTPRGYAPPYYDMKMGIDKVHGEFIPVSIITPASVTGINRNRGSLSFFDCARKNYDMSLNFFYVDPHVTDSIFQVAADSSDMSDPFMVNMYLDIKAVRPMSVLGLPNF